MVPLGDLMKCACPEELALLSAAEKDPSGISAKVYADWLDGRNRAEEAAVWRNGNHDYEDVSYHGSPLYQCRGCETMKYRDTTVYCFASCKRSVFQLRMVENLEHEEYLKLKAERERWEYLKAKWENT